MNPLIGGKLYSQGGIVRFIVLIVAGVAMALGLAGCGTTSNSAEYEPLDPRTKAIIAEPTLLKEGDVLSIVFPGAVHLNTRAKITDGKISLPYIGEVNPIGKTIGELEKELLVKYDKQLQRKEITVALESSTLTVVVSGPGVMRAGKISSDRPLTLLEAVTEAGIDFSKAKLSAIRVIRSANGRVENFVVDLEKVIKGKSTDSQPFYLKQGDVVIVPERLVIF